MREVPYYTSDDDTQWTGHIWRQRDRIGGRWGFAYEVFPPFDENPIGGGWRETQEAAEHAMNESLKRHKELNAS